MGKFNFEKLKKHTEYTLNYTLKDITTGDVVEFDITPVMADRTNFLEMVSKKGVGPKDIVAWFTELALRGETPSNEEKAVFEEFALAHYGEIQTQTMIGFKLTTQEELDTKIAELNEKVIEKKLM